MNCPNCQQLLEANTRFCIACGLIFIGAAARGSKRSAETAATVVKTDPLLGRTLDARYELLARLGQGGMGTVYRARRVHIGDEVAVKVLHRNYSTEEDMIQRFRREAQAAAALRHPNVVTIYDYSETRADALAYIVMELVPGVSLGQFLKDGNRLPLHRAVALLRHICAGVGAAHRRQIVHRDLKPDNIIVVPPSSESETETVKVVDFGIAKLRDLAATHALTQSGMIIGTPFYMSPEQCRGDELDARSDVYSLGVMFYEMLAGRRPFNAPTPTGVIAKHLTQAPPPLHTSLKIPRSVEAVLMRALAKEPQARQVNATAFAFELEQALTNARKNVAAINCVPNVPSFAPQAKSHVGRNALVAVVALVCLLAGAKGLLPYRSLQTPPTQTVRQQEQPIAAQTPGRINPASSPKTVSKTNNVVPETRSSVAKPQPSVAVMSDTTSRTAHKAPLPTPLGPYKGRVNSTNYFREFFGATPTIEPVPVKQSAGRKSSVKKADEMPSEIRQMLKQVLGQTLTTRQPDGKVTTVHVMRQGN